MLNRKGKILYLTSDRIFKPYKELFHLYTTRFYGVSKGGFYSLDLGSKYNSQEDIKRNRDIFFKEFSIPLKEHFNLEHKDRIFLVDNLNKEYWGDAFLTFSYNLPLYMYFADCLPIYLYLPDYHLIGLIHGGWRSTLLNIAYKTINFIKVNLSIKDVAKILIWIGPGICGDCFEVSEDVFLKFKEEFLTYNRRVFLIKRNNKFFIDLKKLTMYQLINAGIKPENIEVSNLCTRCNFTLFFSYRRQGINSGRQLGLIMQKEE